MTNTTTDTSARERIEDCEGCDKPLFQGDQGFSYEDVVVCADCAPTNADLLQELMETDADRFDDPNDKALAISRFRALVDPGKGDLKALHEL